MNNETTEPLKNGLNPVAIENSIAELRQQVQSQRNARMAEVLVDGASEAIRGVRYGKLAERYGPFVLQLVFSAGVITGLLLTIGIAAVPDIIAYLTRSS